MKIRVGFGYDVHKLMPGRDLCWSMNWDCSDILMPMY